jgi:hypothetical protein
VNIEATLRRPEMLQSDKSVRLDIQDPVMAGLKMLKQLRPVGKCRYREPLVRRDVVCAVEWSMILS